jgi:transposase
MGTPSIVALQRGVVIGADTRSDTIHLVALDETGRLLADAEFPTIPGGYVRAVSWARAI